ncbi:MAG: DedA family protein [archaeon]|nr:DedA family protein [archaeon]
MSLSQSLFNFIVHLMATAGYGGIFALMVLESATLPVPSEVVLPFAGYLVYQGTMNFWMVLIVASAGSLLGTVIDYAVGFYLGRAAIIRYGKYVHLSEKNLVSTEKWFKKYGPITVLIARFVPLIRTLVAFPAGIAEMKIPKFLAYSIVGIVIWDAALIYVGYAVGPSVNSIIASLSSSFTVVEILAVVIAALVLFLWAWRSSKQSKKRTEEESHDKAEKL